MRGLPIVQVPHPVGGQKPNQVHQKAEQIAHEVVAALVKGKVKVPVPPT